MGTTVAVGEIELWLPRALEPALTALDGRTVRVVRFSGNTFAVSFSELVVSAQGKKVAGLFVAGDHLAPMSPTVAATLAACLEVAGQWQSISSSVQPIRDLEVPLWFNAREHHKEREAWVARPLETWEGPASGVRWVVVTQQPLHPAPAGAAPAAANLDSPAPAPPPVAPRASSQEPQRPTGRLFAVAPIVLLGLAIVGGLTLTREQNPEISWPAGLLAPEGDFLLLQERVHMTTLAPPSQLNLFSDRDLGPGRASAAWFLIADKPHSLRIGYSLDQGPLPYAGVLLALSGEHAPFDLARDFSGVALAASTSPVADVGVFVQVVSQNLAPHPGCLWEAPVSLDGADQQISWDRFRLGTRCDAGGRVDRSFRLDRVTRIALLVRHDDAARGVPTEGTAEIVGLRLVAREPQLAAPAGRD